MTIFFIKPNSLSVLIGLDFCEALRTDVASDVFSGSFKVDAILSSLPLSATLSFGSAVPASLCFMLFSGAGLEEGRLLFLEEDRRLLWL